MDFCRFIDKVIIFFILLVIEYVRSDEVATLKAVVMLTRHGDRAPAHSYPFDPYKDYPWPGGLGALTPEGFEQLYQSGQIKSTRYRSLLFDPECSGSDCDVDFDKISALSSAVPRCIASATSFLIGFLGTIWPPDILQIIPQNLDEMLAEPGKFCKKYVSTFSSPLNEDQWRLIRSFSGSEPLPAYIEKHTGNTYKKSVDAFGIYDTLSIELDHGLRLPRWAEDIYSSYLGPLALISFQTLTSSSYLKVRDGVLLNDMTNKLEALMDGDSEQNVIFYSAHDVTIAGLTNNLGVINETGHQPEYGAMVCLELHEKCRNCSENYEIKLLYFKNFSVVEPVHVELPGCKSPCEFSKFRQIIEPKLVYDYDKTCLNQ